MGRRFAPPDPRPSKADPHHRAKRKELEKDHFEWVPGVILGLMGVTLMMNVEKQVEKYEQRHKEKESKEEEQRRRKREKEIRYGGSDRGTSYDRGYDRAYDRDRGSSRDDRYYYEPDRKDERRNRRYSTSY
ncbi:hypothetical protein UCRPA7_7908 [Phaeoacremonium minimum UCRPA7]|uniref:Uncharacterized protein n=1 Tax=Phaeoacremonium minimum (strain UCR-PA7) TaxID=1286976 RepID=R8BBC6_PHAM7|nr:hypothetical protein UCRPA7_7908 [Phaeoacremonium minimum UCRPA7]EON96600.1 hypothetical protein UCRPA7_7908 [Phaeoacremonium minimum UCRPA7]